MIVWIWLEYYHQTQNATQGHTVAYMTKIDIELAKYLIDLIERSGETLKGETAREIYSIIYRILAKYGYKLPPLPSKNLQR